jgi:hypothetical protein
MERKTAFHPTSTLIAIALTLICAATYYLVRSNARETRDFLQCHGNLMEIRRALSFYRDKYGSFPKNIYDKDGKPMHSWRVLLLPYLGEENLYGRYSFDEPWDGPENLRLVSEMPDIYRCPADSGSQYNTSYLAITSTGGLNTAFSNDDQSHDLRLWAVEVKNSGIIWMEPRDIDLDIMTDSAQKATPVPSSNHRRGINAVTPYNVPTLDSNITLKEFVFDSTKWYKESWTEEDKSALDKMLKTSQNKR